MGVVGNPIGTLTGLAKNLAENYVGANDPGEAPPKGATPSPGQVMIDAEGHGVHVPAERVDEMTAKGYTHGTHLVDPDGNHVVAPTDKAPELVTKGYTKATLPQNSATATYHSNPATNTSLPGDPSRYSEDTKHQELVKQHIISPGGLPAPVRAAINTVPFLGGGEAAELGEATPELAAPSGGTPIRDALGSGARRVQNLTNKVPDTVHDLAPLAGPKGYMASKAVKGVGRVAGAIADRYAPVGAVSTEPYSLTPPEVETEAAVQNKLEFPKPADTELEAPKTGPVPPTVQPKASLKKLTDLVGEQVGGAPLKPNVPLGEQPRVSGLDEDPIKAKYPDPAERRLVRANGEQMYLAAKGDPKLLQQGHELTRVDLRQALINSGEDVGQQTVTDSKFAGSGGIGREEAFKRLFAKNLSLEDIIKLAKQTK